MTKLASAVLVGCSLIAAGCGTVSNNATTEGSTAPATTNATAAVAATGTDTASVAAATGDPTAGTASGGTVAAGD